AAGRGTAHTCALGTGPIRPLRQRPARLPRTVTGVSEDLKNAHVLVTGATGFVGQAVVEKLLSAYPSTRITVLVRPRGALSAQARVDKLLHKPVFAPWRERVGAEQAEAEAAQRLTVLAGDLEDVPPLPADLDVVVHSASTVRSEEHTSELQSRFDLVCRLLLE